MPNIAQNQHATATEGLAAGTRILVVEDDALVASCIRDVLEDTGFTITGIASTGAEAFALVREARPRVALVDIKLAGPIDGIEVARELRERFAVPSIFLSGAYEPDIVERSRVARPLGFLKKPFRPSQVFNALEKALAAQSET
jgi:two-component system, response regulator PdtaR